MPTPIMHIPILYGSQTGNSQSCAETFAKSLPTTLYKHFSSSEIKITSVAKDLDDFLEKDRAEWPRFFVIICSSYGVGQAPLGCWKFRELCDAILENDDSDADTKLKGLKYSMLGLGDSKYTTFFLNPTALDSALSKAGAERIGSLGKADASGVGDKVQSKVMEEWCDNIIPEIVWVVKAVLGESDDEKKLLEESLMTAKEQTCLLCAKLFDDWDENNATPDGKSSMNNIIPFLALVVAVLLAMFAKRSS